MFALSLEADSYLCACGWGWPLSVGAPGAGVVDSCELPGAGAEHPTQGLGKSSSPEPSLQAPHPHPTGFLESIICFCCIRLFYLIGLCGDLCSVHSQNIRETSLIGTYLSPAPPCELLGPFLQPTVGRQRHSQAVEAQGVGSPAVSQPLVFCACCFPSGFPSPSAELRTTTASLLT